MKNHEQDPTESQALLLLRLDLKRLFDPKTMAELLTIEQNDESLSDLDMPLTLSRSGLIRQIRRNRGIKLSLTSYAPDEDFEPSHVTTSKDAPPEFDEVFTIQMGHVSYQVDAEGIMGHDERPVPDSKINDIRWLIDRTNWFLPSQVVPVTSEPGQK